ncbi:MAG: hypothetical protein V1808_01970 [Candidatus Daviesbacteria bacterium]
MEKLINTVVKVGSSSLINRGEIDVDLMSSIARQVYFLREKSRFVMITSGAIASGKLTLGNGNGDDEIYKQVLAAVGQRPLINTWGKAFDKYGIPTGLFLFAEGDLEKPTLPLNNALLRGIVPIINANDTVSTEEVEKLAVSADNDRLACFVASYLLDSQKLILLTEAPGVLDVNGKVIRSINCVEDLLKIGNFDKTSIGTGGIESKILEARRFINRLGKEAYIASASEDDVIIRIFNGEDVGTKVTLPLQGHFNI